MEIQQNLQKGSEKRDHEALISQVMAQHVFCVEKCGDKFVKSLRREFGLREDELDGDKNIRFEGGGCVSLLDDLCHNSG